VLGAGLLSRATGDGERHRRDQRDQREGAGKLGGSPTSSAAPT
jgi:hypothetical protein